MLWRPSRTPLSALRRNRVLTMTGVMIHTDDYMTIVMMIQAPSTEFHGASKVRLLRPAASDTEAVLTMLARCSRASLFHRFHGFTDGVDYFGALLRDGPVDETFLAWYRVRLRWGGHARYRCHGSRRSRSAGRGRLAAPRCRDMAGCVFARQRSSKRHDHRARRRAGRRPVHSPSPAPDRSAHGSN